MTIVLQLFFIAINFNKAFNKLIDKIKLLSIIKFRYNSQWKKKDTKQSTA